MSCAMLVAVCCLAAPAAEPWRVGAPESQGLSSAGLETLRAGLARRGTEALLVIRHDTVVLEWYGPGFGASQKHGTASLAKALVGGLSCAVALTDGRLSLDEPASKYLPAWRGDARKAAITVRQLGSHTAGLGDAEADDQPHDRLTGWRGEFWRRLPVPRDPFTLSRDEAPVEAPPGMRMAYSNPGLALLTWCVTAALGQDVRTVLRRRVMQPLGLGDSDWSVGYGQTFTVDGLPLVPSWGGGAYTARAAARVGRLLLRGGDWDGQRLLSSESVRQTTTDAGTPGPCGQGWWSNNEGDCPRLPRDAFFGSGAGHQLLLVVPSLDLVLVRFGTALPVVAREPNAHHEAYRRYVFEPLLDALTDGPPYPLSRALLRLDWAPPESVVRRGHDSDCWPLTWADDDRQYTAYGDGRGFEPGVPTKLSLGLAWLDGGPADFVGTNLRAPQAEARGDGRRGRKPSGLLCVQGVLYLLVRNADHAQLGWSSDHGATWTWADWRFDTSFGCPTILNFGRDYAGARDDYVYLYSPDSDTAYDPADRLVLARVPRTRLRTRTAYEFLAGLDAAGQPRWSTEIARRGAVFSHPRRCWRVGVTYDAGLRRYLLVQVLPESRHRDGPRFQGGLGVYEAPEPWGPWSTLYFTNDWDLGPGESGSFPTRWMSRDGCSLALACSSEDALTVRRAKMVPAP